MDRLVPGVTWTHDFKFPGNLVSLDALEVVSEMGQDGW